ncbi:MAG TPA: efflux RND transporter periplasmic adaptor subunit [Magnetospirillaceae bacterium]
MIAAAVVYRLHTTTGAPAARGFRSSGPLPVGFAAATKGDVKITINALGTVTPLDTVTVLSQVAGPLTAVDFHEGQEVKQGDLLAQIDPRPFQATVDQAQGTLLKDQAVLKEAQVDLIRYKTLAAQNSIARQQSEDQEYVVQQDDGQVKVDQANLDTAKLNLSYTRVVSPITGRIGLRLVDPGNYVQAGTLSSSSGTGIAVITQMQPIAAVFALPEDNITAVMSRMHQGAQLNVAAFDRSGATNLGSGTLAAVDSQINTSTGTVNLKAQFANADEALFPNQFINIVLTVNTLHDATIIPTAAVQRGAPGTFVYLIQSDQTVKMQPIKLGPVDGENIAVQSGLQVGDKVVVDGADKLKDGAKVVLHSENASGQQTAPASGAPGNQQQPTDKSGDKQSGDKQNGDKSDGTASGEHRHHKKSDSNSSGDSQ